MHYHNCYVKRLKCDERSHRTCPSPNRIEFGYLRKAVRLPNLSYDSPLV